MASAEDVSDRETLEAWLRERSSEDALCIAHRAALRVAPQFWREVGAFRARERDLTALDTLWPTLTSGVARKYPTPEVIQAAAAARATAAAATTAARATAAAATTAADATTAARATAAAAAAATAAAATAADAAAFAAAAATFAAAAATADAAAYAAAAFAAAAATADADAAAAAAWESVREDCARLERREDLDLTPLWTGAPPAELAKMWAEVRAEWSEAGGPVWNFWIRWYENALEGRPQDWPLLRDIALIPPEDWKGGPDRVHPIIEKMLIDRAIAMTPNAERVLLDGNTGLFRLETVSRLGADHLADAIDMLRDAQAIFHGHEGGNHPYATIADERELIEQGVVAYAARPRMLYNVTIRVGRRINTKVANGDCPRNDPLIEDYQSQIAAVADKLRTHDPEVKAAVIAEAATRLDLATPQQRQEIVSAARAVAEVSEGALKEELPALAEVAANPDADPSDRKSAIYVTSSRLLRVWIASKGRMGDLSRHVEAHPVKYGFLGAVILALLTLL